jgi:hypothetical protein
LISWDAFSSSVIRWIKSVARVSGGNAGFKYGGAETSCASTRGATAALTRIAAQVIRTVTTRIRRSFMLYLQATSKVKVYC